MAKAMQIMPVMLDGLVGLAALHAAEGESLAALELLHSISQHPAANRETLDRAARLHTALTVDHFEADHIPPAVRSIESLVADLL